MTERYDIAVIGAGPAGAATAIRAARAGARVLVVDVAAHGRDKVCGDGLTPRAVAALHELGIPLDDAHRIDGLRMIAGKRTRELPWPASGRFPADGAVWPRRRLDKALIDAAAEAGAEIRLETPGEPLLDDSGASWFGILAGDTKVEAGLVVAADRAAGKVARMLGAERDPTSRSAWRFARTSSRRATTTGISRRASRCATSTGTWVPGYGWMFPAATAR